METSGARPHQRQRNASRRSREDAAKAFSKLTTVETAPLVNRLHLNWQSVPATKQARLYSPSTAQLPLASNNRSSGLSSTSASSNKPILSPIEPSKSSASSAQQHSQTRSAAVAAFEQKYAAEDPLMRYVLHVIRSGSPARRSEIPRGKRNQRRVRPEEDVLYLVHCGAPPCGFRNVYWLTFADEGTVLCSDSASSLEYFTLGSHGLTRFKGGQGVEFSELANWVDEKHAFDSMTNIKGLKRIQQMIFFFSWKRQAVQRRLRRVRERLASSLFISHPIARHLLLNVRDACTEIEDEAEREYVEADTSYTLERLAHIHEQRVRDATAAITKRIQSLCVMINDATRDISRCKEEQGCSYAIRDHEEFSKTLRLSSLRERMFTFLRLVDCHVAEAIYQHMTLVVQDLRARICGQQGAAQSVGDVERSGNLCHSDLCENARRSTSLAPAFSCVTYTIQAQTSDRTVVAVPGLFVSLEDDVSFEGEVHSATIHFVPSKVEVLELIHAILMKYCVALDGLPRVLTDKLFERVLTPFVPSTRRGFAESLLKPSHLVLETYEPELRQMRAALELHFRRLGILQQEHLRCIRAIKVAERESPVVATRRNSMAECAEADEEDTRLPELPDLSSSAAAYELAQKTWSRFVRYASSAASMLQVGFLLLDERSFVDRLRSHVSKRVAEMDDALPLIYQQFLTSLLEDVDGRIDKITKIPTNLEEANAWLTQVTSMMPSRPFRQRLDTKIANLARLRILIKERGLVSLEIEAQDAIRKLELTWESVIETLLVCLARVEERGSEHRRSVHDVISKVDEYISGQLQLIIGKFEEIPSGCEEQDGDGAPSSLAVHSDKDDLLQQLEDLVAMDIERKSVVQQFEEYDREHRASMDMPPLQQPVWTSSISSTSSKNLSAVSMTDKLPSELLLLYIITSLELRQWFESWKKMQDKWLGSPLTGVHPGTMINRIKLFRRRLAYASSRLSRLSSVLVQSLVLEQHEDKDCKESASFAKKDFELMRVFDSSIEEMSNCNRIFQAISGGAFSEARWAAMNQLLNVNTASNGGGHLTLRLMKEKCDAGQVETFLVVCDECIVEAKLHVKLEQARQRLARIEVRVEETNYSVACEGIAEALAQLDEIAVDVNLCLFGQNPELQLCLELRADLERKVSVCEHILSYQKHWRLRCEATKLHEMDEFFSKRFSGGDFALPRGQKSHRKTGLKQEQTVWQAFLDASHAWSDRLRRLFFVSPPQVKVEPAEQNQRSLLGRKSAVAPAPMTINRRRNTAAKSMNCTLDDVIKSFEGFDFEANFAVCERGIELVHNYLASIREKAPRMYCLDESSMLRLLLRDSDVKQLHQSLAICFPQVHRFALSRAANRVGSTVEVFGKPGTSVRASKTAGTIVIMGLEGLQDPAGSTEKSGHFRLPVAKIGRVKFWFTRLEEEMSSMVLTDLKRAFEWATQDFASAELGDYDSLLPQSIVTAFGLRFTFDMNQALRSNQYETKFRQLIKVQVGLRGRLEGLVTMRRAEKTSSSVRLENMLLLGKMQAEIVDRVVVLLGQGRQEDALFFWSMQLQTRVYVETMTTANATVQLNPGKLSKGERNELLPSSPDFLKIPSANHSGQPMSFSVCCQVAHLQMPLGQEFVGWRRLAVLSPFTQRCSYALFSALRMHHTALVVPYNVDRAGTAPTSLLWGIAQLLLRPCTEFACDPSAGGAATIHHIGNLMSFTSKLNGFLIVRHLVQLSTALVGVVHEKILQHFHHAAPAGNINPHYPQEKAVTNLLVLPRHPGGILYGASSIFVPLESTEELQRSGLIRSVRTAFRAVAVSRPAIKYTVECMLIADGFTSEQTRELNVVEAVEAIDAGEAGPIGVSNVESLISRVIREARRLRDQYRVVWDLNLATGGGKARNSTHQESTESSEASKMEIREGQFIFRQAFLSAIEALVSKEQDGGECTPLAPANALLVRVFALSMGGRLVTKGKGDEEAVAAAVTIYLESAYALPADCGQFELVMELWRALQTFPAAFVYGSPGSGKTTCITALHRALLALEMSEQNQENEDVAVIHSQANPSLSQLVILNPQLLTLEQFYENIAMACGAAESVKWKQSSSSLKWVLVDGEIDGGMLDRLLESDNRACSSASSLPSSSVLYRGQSSNVISGDYSDSSDSPRLLFEVVSVADLSPSALQKCWALHVPSHCITVASIIRGWRSRWENQPIFSPDSPGFEAMTVVFKTVDVLLSRICVPFANEEATADRTDADMAKTAGLKLGNLSLNHITQTALAMVSLCFLQNKSLLQELPYFRLVELVAFALLWGFAGHLPGPSQIKLESYVRAKSKEHSETRHLAELQRSLLDANYFEDVWAELQPRFAAPLSVQPATGGKNVAKPEAKMESAFDSSNGHALVLVPRATSLVRVCTLLLHSSHSFLLIGPAASGKTSLLRWLMHRNTEVEAARMKMETSLDERHVHGILDWTRVPGAWFSPLNQHDTGAESRAKMREESELFATRSRHSFVFLDDLDASERLADKAQVEFARTMLDHRVGYSTKRGGFHSVEKRIGAGMRLSDMDQGTSPTLTRFMRHFAVLRVPTYTQKELLSVFRIKFGRHFNAEVSEGITDRQLSAKGNMGGGGQQLALEEVVLRASVDFAVEMAAFQQLGSTEHPCLALFNLHHVNMLLERTLTFATNLSASYPLSEGTTLVQLGKAHQSWLSELKNIFLSNCPVQPSAESSVAKMTSKAESSDEIQKKILAQVRHLSEKYFSVAFRGNNEHSFPISVETLHFLVRLAESHLQAPLLQPRLVQLRELLNEQMTASNGVSWRSSDQARASVNGFTSLSSPTELVSNVLLAIAATSTSSEAGSGLHDRRSRPYSSGQVTSFQMKLLLSCSWCLTQATHLIHALSQQQIVVSSSPRHGRLLSDRLLRFACDLHGYKVHVVDLLSTSEEDPEGRYSQVIRSVLGAAGVCQERVALWIRERQITPHTRCLLDAIQEFCLGKLPSVALLPGGEELRDELVLGCIQSRKQLEIVTEAELMAEFQQRLRQNFRLCILEEREDERGVSNLLHWMKSRPSCHWRRLEFTELELQRLLPEMAKGSLLSPALCGVDWDVQRVVKYTNLCQNVHLGMMRAYPEAADPSSQLDYFLSFMTNATVTYKTKLQSRQTNILRLTTALETLAFARNEVVPSLERRKQELMLQSTQTDKELERISTQHEVELMRSNKGDSLAVDEPVGREMEETQWILRSQLEELLMLKVETSLRLEQVSRLLADWQHVSERVKHLSTKWTRELDQEQRKTEYEIMAVALYVSALRVYPHMTSVCESTPVTCVNLLSSLLFESDDSSPDIEERLVDASIDDSEDEHIAVIRLIWTSRFSFLRNQEIYRTIRLADELCDRVPVIVDPSGVLQRFLVHFFSGHTLFSTFPGCGDPGEVESEHPSESKRSMVISCDDQKLKEYLQEAQRLGIPVLLVNFRSSDSVLLDQLQPFLDQTRLSHALPRRPMLRELTMEYYEDQRRQRQRRTSNTASSVESMPAVAQTAATGAAKMARRVVRATGSKPQMTIDPASITAAVAANTTPGDLAKTLDRRDARRKSQAISGSPSNGRNFQIYAVTDTPVPLEVRHSLAAHFAHFPVLLSDSDLETLFELPRVGKAQQNLLQELRDDQVGLADCSMKQIMSRAQLDQIFSTLKPAVYHNDSPFAARTANQVTIQLQERYSELAVQLAKDYQAELTWTSREQSLEAKVAELERATQVFAPMALQLVAVGRCMAAVSSSLTIGARTTPFYLQNVRYLENAATQQLAVQGDDSTQLSVHGRAALLARVSSGFVSDSHRQIFCFLELVQRQVQTRTLAPSKENQRKGALIWILTSHVRRSRFKHSASLDASDEDRQRLGIFPRRNSVNCPGDSGASVAERLRRRVKLCAYLFNGWKASRGSKNARGKPVKASRSPLDGSTVSTQTDGVGKHDNDSGCIERREIVIEQLQQKLDTLLAKSEALWYEWKTTRLRLQLDVEQLISDLGCQPVLGSSAVYRGNRLFPSAITLVTLDELSARFKVDAASPADDENTAKQLGLVRLLLAKAFFPSSFAQTLAFYFQLHSSHANTSESNDASAVESWTAWPSPASLVVDVAPPRGKYSRIHLPRALIMYMPQERGNVEQKFSAWNIATFVDTSADSVAFRDELIVLITTKHKFVLELLNARHAESALCLVSKLINEHALLSVPEWYILASFSVATMIQNGKFAVMDRIAVFSSSELSQLDFVDRGRGRTTEQTIKERMVEESGASESVASALTLSVLTRHRQGEHRVMSSAVRDLEDVVLHLSTIEEVTVDTTEQEQMTNTLLRLVKPDVAGSCVTRRSDATKTALLSSSLLSDLLSVGSSSLAMLTQDATEEWLPRHAVTDGVASCDQLWTHFCRVRDMFLDLQTASALPIGPSTDVNGAAVFFPWESFDRELENQFSAFEAIHKHLILLRTAAESAVFSRQQQISSLARGYVPFDWIETFFAGTAWPPFASGVVSIAQLLLLIACRVGVLVRCIRGDRAWALNLAVVSDAHGFLHSLRSYTAVRSGLLESALTLVLELDSSDMSGGNVKTKKVMAIAKQFGAILRDKTREGDWHGAVLRRSDGGAESWGIRVEGLVLMTATTMYPLPVCRVMCQPCVAATSTEVNAPLMLLTSLSPYQPEPCYSQQRGNADNGVRLVLGQSINSVVEMRDNAETMQYALGVPVFPDDDSNDTT
ncbi:hypothetical protein GN958_ATG04284 [Phytophthora infestans]|uniref:Dynein heavy chain n=1 Tax=Phytophthora infestans TaxID=4787 RepID=A0A8S9V128_PHYIN|nr:hypothetical protein GN958_ATG04284 [Phytophthora infestans]